MADVAQAAGVSHQTVSRVLNGHPNVRPETRAKVMEAIEALGYRRNLAARALVTRQTNTIGMVVVEANLSGPTGALVGIEAAARERGYWVSVSGAGSLGQGMAATVSHFIDQGVDGIVVVAPSQASLDSAIEAAGDVPAVYVTTGAVPGGVTTVDIDQAMGIRQLVRLLIGFGHRRIGLAAGPVAHLHAQARERAWREALAEAGLEPGPRVQADWTAASGYEAALAFLAQPGPPTAVLGANDLVALGLLRGFREAGVDVPGQVSVTGFDNIQGTDQTVPPLTTVHQDFTALGARCVDLLVGAIQGREVESEQVPTKLIVRASTAPPGRVGR
jgi:DNA-binding LacI/PurR family transcriptional regulator